MHNLKEHLELWLNHLDTQRRLSPHTLRAYTGDVQHFLSFLFQHMGAVATLETLESLTLRDCRAWLAARHKDFDGRSNARAVAAVKNLWQFLLRHHLIKNDVFLSLKTPKFKKSLPRPLNMEQTEFLLDTIETLPDEPWIGLRDKALVILLYGTGMRISEALSLTQKDAHMDTLMIKGKGNKERPIPLLDEVKSALQDYLMQCPYQGNDQPLFLGIRGKCLQSAAAAKVLRVFRRTYNLPETLSPHALRHTCASHLMNASTDLRGIQTLLGHASLSSTQIYTKLDMTKLLEIYKKAHPRQ